MNVGSDSIPTMKRKGGRPRVSKLRSPLESDDSSSSYSPPSDTPSDEREKRGRPKGSKNKPKLSNEMHIR